MKLSGKVYDFLKWRLLPILSALGALYFTVSEIWGLPYGAQVEGTFAAIATFASVIVGASKRQYDRIQQAKEDIDDGTEKER